MQPVNLAAASGTPVPPSSLHSPPPPHKHPGKLEGALGALGRSEAEAGVLRDEYRALGEDMEALVRESQVRGVKRGCV